jgi:hypothetical protein
MFGVFAEMGLAATLWIWSWGGSAADETPFGAAASTGCVTAALVLVAAALVVRFMDERAETGAVLAGLVAVGLVTVIIAVMAFMVLTANVTLWFLLLWSAGSAAVLGFGLASRIRDRSRGGSAERRP